MTSGVAACLQICLQPHQPAPSHLIDQTASKNYSYFFFKPFVQIERLGLQAKVHCSLQHRTVIQSHFHWCYWPVWDWWPDAATMGFSGAATTLGTEVFICNRRTKLRALAGTFNYYEYPNSTFHWKNVFLYVDSTRSLTSTLAIWFRAFVIKVCICQTSLRILSQSTSKQNKTNKNSNQQVGSLKSLDSCIRKAKIAFASFFLPCRRGLHYVRNRTGPTMLLSLSQAWQMNRKCSHLLFLPSLPSVIPLLVYTASRENSAEGKAF